MSAPTRPVPSRTQTGTSTPRHEPEPEAPGESAVSLVVADPQAIDRSALAALLRHPGGFRVLAEVGSAEEAIERCRRVRPDVLLLTLSLPSASGDPALPLVIRALPELKVVAMSERGWGNCLVLNPPSRANLPPNVNPRCENGIDCLQLAAAQGARATVRRSADPHALFAAIRTVAAGHQAYEPGTIETLAAQRPRSGRALSARELEVAALLAEGMSNKEISTALEISEPTVKKHVGRVLVKLGVQDRLQAGLFVARHPLLFQPTPRTPVS
ncbi:MAG: LuxR C-terminal-related transcriptional regulator [Candidatus Eisenbacteria bacterium]